MMLKLNHSSLSLQLSYLLKRFLLSTANQSVYFDYFALKILIINYQKHPTRGGKGGGGGQYPLTQNDNKKRMGDPLGLAMRVQIPPLSF